MTCFLKPLVFFALIFAVLVALCHGHWAEAGLFCLLAFQFVFMIHAKEKCDAEQVTKRDF